ncbi:MAG: TipAS antibiotic-recognition domain-containing protein [Eggerthellaceae bacterium]|nr:TipAS antibiotic-recognition domain-containing protein [Eggerthellaceae bacterium]
MAIKDTIAAIRKEAGITQGEMARRLYVTRQAVSRWETGETAPGIDMVKLICVTFGVPLERFFDMPMSYYCQCCSMPMPEASLRGTEADGAKSGDFCMFCYDHGDFTAKGVSMDEFIEATAPMEAEALGISLDEAVSLMATLLPHLKRWREVADNEEAYGAELRERFGDEVMDAANKKYVMADDAAHLQASELELAIKEQLRRAMEAGGMESPEAQRLCAMHKRWLTLYWPDGLYTPEAHKGLADGYLADARFQKYYEEVAPGATQFLRDAIHAWADKLA